MYKIHMKEEDITVTLKNSTNDLPDIFCIDSPDLENQPHTPKGTPIISNAKNYLIEDAEMQQDTYFNPNSMQQSSQPYI
jgi:hypothetical protein